MLTILFLRSMKSMYPKFFDSKYYSPAILITKLGQGYVFTGVCDSVHRGEYLTRYTTPTTPHQEKVHPPRPGTPLGPGTPPDHVHPPGNRYPPGHSMLGDTVYAQAVRILLECNLFLLSRSPELN